MGLYPAVAVDSGPHIASKTIASTLSEEGFATAGFHSNPFVSRAYGFDEGFDHFDDDLHLSQHKLIALAQRALDKLRNRHYARAEEINKRSLEWIDSLNDDQPFFLWNHYMDTHGPYEPPGEYATLYADEGLQGHDAQSLYHRAIDDPGSITEDERQLLINLYDGEIRYNDMRIGEFFDSLRERGLLEETLLIVTADHGDAFGEHGYYEHPRYLHDEVTHVPLFVRRPGRESGKVETPVSTLDICATLERSVGQATPFSLLDNPDEERRVFSQARGEGGYSHVRRYAVRTASETCFCQRDIDSGAIEFVETETQALQTELESHIEQRVRVENGAGPSEEKEVDEEVERRLSALGYTE
jgi:arylsulfatase